MENFDPTKSSPVPQSLELAPKEVQKESVLKGEGNKQRNVERSINVYSDAHSGEEYINKGNFREVEHFVSLLSKGILNVSDVVEKEGEYFSRKMPLENVEAGTEADFEAEMFLLNFLFADWDHQYANDEGMNMLAKQRAAKSGHGDNVLHYQNVIKNDEGQFVHYDYGKAFGSDQDQEADIFKKSKTNDPFLGLLTRAHLLYKFKPSLDTKNLTISRKNSNGVSYADFKASVAEKVNAFDDALKDEGFFSKVVEKSKIDLNRIQFSFLKKDGEEGLREYLLHRVEVLKDIVNP